MAVVQISKIQVRRGLKNSGIGVPQLSSAEFAWAVDSQELYIGNGSVAEGAPYVGNTKILTEHDNILELAGSYQFAAQDPAIAYSVPRSLQTKIDEIEVSVIDFGAVGDGSTSNNTAFENALDDLFIRNAGVYRKILKVPNGHYLFTSDLKIPSGTIIRGETQKGAVLEFGANNITFVTATGLELSSFDSTNRPRDVEISNISINRSTGQFVLTGVKDTIIDNVIFQGEHIPGSSVLSLTSRPAAIFWQNLVDKPKTTGIVFRNCKFNDQPLAVKCLQDDQADTAVSFQGCHFFINDVGVYVEGTLGQISNWSFDACKFEEIYRQAFYATAGRGFLFTECDFIDCGNASGNSASPDSTATEIVYFEDFKDNRLIECTSDRHQSYSITSSETRKAYPEVINAGVVKFVDRQYADIRLSVSQTPLAVFSALTKFINIEYTLKLNTHTRNGRLTITVDDDRTNVAITDEFQYSSSLITSPGGTLMTNFQFGVSLKDNDSNGSVDTVLLSYENPSTNIADTGTISYQISYGV